jgi:hypothetical protein
LQWSLLTMSVISNSKNVFRQKWHTTDYNIANYFGYNMAAVKLITTFCSVEDNGVYERSVSYEQKSLCKNSLTNFKIELLSMSSHIVILRRNFSTLDKESVRTAQ